MFGGGKPPRELFTVFLKKAGPIDAASEEEGM